MFHLARPHRLLPRLLGLVALPAFLTLLVLPGVSADETREDSGAVAPVVPDEFRDVYDSLSASIDRADAVVDAAWDGELHDGFVPMASLLTANSNLGPTILHPDNLPYTRLYLRRLKELGCEGVQLDIQFPILDDDYFAYCVEHDLMAEDAPRAADYLAYYERVVREVRAADMKLAIESQVTFVDDVWSPLPVEEYYATFDRPGGVDDYNAHRLAQVRLLATRLEPDFLTVVNEPDTEAWQTGIRALRDTDTLLAAVEALVDGVREVLPEGVALGAGLGIWSPAWREWTERMCAMDVDFLNLHIYAIDLYPDDDEDVEDNAIPRMLAACDIAREHDLDVVIGENWLYKTGPNDDPQDIVEIYGRDYLDYWAPLDARYLGVIVKLAHAKQLAYVSPFWSTLFFTLLTHDEAKDLSTAERKQTNNRRVLAALRDGTYTPIGDAYAELLANGPTRRYAPDWGSHETASELLTLDDDERDKALLCRVTHPILDDDEADDAYGAEPARDLPLIVFSHGLFGGRNNYDALVKFWASNGYVCVQVSHRDSLELGRPSTEDTRAWEERVDDVTFLLGATAAIEIAIPALAGRIDPTHAGVGGHSYGGQTASLIGGATAVPDAGSDLRRGYLDERALATLLLSPTGSSEFFALDEHSWDDYAAPMMVVSGSDDVPVEWHTEPYDRAPTGSGQTYLVFIDGATHMLGGIAGAREGRGPRRLRPNADDPNEDHIRYVQQTSLAFWDAHVRANPAAKTWLESGPLARGEDPDVALTAK